MHMHMQLLSVMHMYAPAQTEQTEPCDSISNGCAWSLLPAAQLRYLKIQAKSFCKRCINDDYVDDIALHVWV